MGKTTESLMLAGTAIDGLSQSSKVAVISMLGLSDAEAAVMLESAGLSAQEAATTAATIASGTAATGASAGFTAFAASIKTATTGLITFLTTNPVGWAILAGTAIFGAVKAVDALTESYDEAKEKSASSREEYQNTKTELESINSELETTGSRIDELKAKGSLTLTEEDELSRLELQNQQLQQQYDIKSKLAQIQEKQAADDAANVLTNKSGSVFPSYKNGVIEGNPNSDIIDKTRKNQEELNNVTDKYNRLLKVQSEIANSGQDLFSSWWEEDTTYEKNERVLKEYENQISELQSEISSGLSDINTEYELLFDSNGNIIEGNEDLVSRIKDLFEYTLSSSDKAAEAQEKIDSILSRPTLSDAKDELIAMAQASDGVGISAEYIEKNYSNLADAARLAGVDIQDLVDTINSMAGVENFDEMRKQLQDAFSGDALNLQVFEKLKGEWGDFTKELSNEEISILYGIYQSQDTSAWSIDDWKLALEEAKNGAEESESSYESLKTKIDSVTESMSALKSAMSSSVSGSGISVDEFTAIDKMFSGLDGYDASKLFETTANGIRINTEAARELTAQYEAQTKLDLANKLSELGSEYDDLTEQLKNCTDGSEEYNQILSQRDAIEAEIRNVSLLASEYDGLTSKYQKWIDAQSSADEGSMYDNVTSSLEKMKDLYEEGLVGTDDFRTGVDFMTYEDMSTASVDELVEAYKKANKTMNTYFKDGQEGCVKFLEDLHELNSDWASMNKDGSWEIDFNDEDVAKKLGISVEAVQAIMRKLGDYGFDINLESPTKSIQDLKDKIEETEAALKGIGEQPIEINVDADDVNSEIEKAKSKIQEINDSDVSAEVKTAQLEDANAKLDVLIQKKHEAENPAFMSIDVNQVNASLTEALGYLKEYQTAVNDLDELEIKGADSSEIEAAKKQVDELAGKIQGLDKDTKVSIGLEADGSIDSIKKQISDGDVVINVSGDTTQAKTDIDNINGTDVSVNVTTSGNEALDALKSGLESLTDKTVTVTAQTVGKDEVDDLKKAQDAVLDKEVTTESVVKGEKEVKSLTKAIKELTGKVVNVIANVIGKSNVDSLSTSIKNVQSKTVYIRSVSTSSVARYENGTAHAHGTAFASGNWGAKRSETALMGEVGEELLVRGDKWITVGSQGAEFFPVRKNDIIFNAEQTKEIFAKGKLTTGNTRGKSFASGTAYNSTGNGSFYNSGTKVTSSSNATKSSSSSSSKSSSSSNDFKETFDWIEIAVNRVETAIKNLKVTAESVYKTFTTRNTALNKEIKQVTKEISLQQKAYTKYMQQANAVGLSSTWKQKVQNGSISLSTITNEDLADKIKQYQELYEKAQACLTTIAELKETESDLYNQKLELIQSNYSNKIDYYDTLIGNIESAISFAESRGGYGTTSQYSKMESYTRSEIKNLQAERSALQAQLNSSVSKGVIKKYSEQWYEWQNQINSLNGEIYAASEKLAEYAEKIANIPLDKLNAKLEKINSTVEVLDAKYEAAQSATNKNKILAEQNAQAKKELDAYNAASSESQSYVNSLWNSSALKTARKTSANVGKAKGSKLSVSGLAKDSAAYQAVLNYNAALDAQAEALNEAKKASYEYTVTLRENAKQMFENIKTEYESKQSPTNAIISYYNTALSYRDSMGYSQTSDYQKDIYNKLISNTEALLASQEQELNDLLDNYNENKSSMSAADAREARAEIYQLREEILETKASLADLQSDLNSIEVKKLEISLDKLQTKANELEDAISLKEAKGLSATAEDYVALIDNTQKQIDNLEKQNELLREQQEQYSTNSAKYEELREQIEENEDAIREAEKAQVEWNNAIADIPISRLEKALELVQAISDYEESLIDLKVASGEVVTEEDYQKQIEAQNDKLAQLQEERELIYDYYQKALESEDGTYAGKTADEWKKEYTELDTEINQVKIDIIELQDEIDNIDLKNLSNQLDDLEREATKLENSIELKETNGEKVTESDYRALISNSEQQVANLEEQNRLLEEQLSEVEEGSDKYYEIQNQIQDNEEAIARCKQEQAEWNEEIKNLPLKELNAELDELESNLNAIQNEIDLKEASGEKVTEADYQRMIANSQQQVENLEEQNRLLEQQLAECEEGSDKYNEIKAQIAENEDAIAQCKKEQLEWNEAIKNIPLDELNAELDEIEAKMDRIQNSLDIKETKGIKATEEDYRQLIAASQEEVANLEEQNRLLREQQAECEVGSEKYNELQKQIDDNTNAIEQAKKQQAEWNVELENLPIERLEEALELLDSIDEKTKSEIELKEARGEDLTEEDYQRQIADNNDQINNLQEKRAEATSNYQKALASEDGVYGGKTADEWKAVINETDAAINELKIENEELKDSLRDDVYWRTFERMHDEIERTADVLDGISDLIDDDMLFDSDGNLTQYGVDKIALLTKQYELARKEVQNYTNDIENLNKLYAEGQYTEEEYNEKLAELQSGLLDAASDMKEYQDAILDMYKSMEQSELDALFEVIDARNECLKKKKEYYDFDKTIRGKTKDIQSLEAQLAALEGISGAEAAAKRAKLQAELSEAQEDLDDTLKEHEFEIAQESLDAMKDTLQDAFDDRWDDIASDMDEVQKLMNDANQIVESSTAQINTSLNDLLNYYGINASATEIDTVSGVGYNNGYSGGSTGTSSGSANTGGSSSTSGSSSGMASDISNAFSEVFGDTELNIAKIESILESLYSGTDAQFGDLQDTFAGLNSETNYNIEDFKNLFANTYDGLAIDMSVIEEILAQIQSITPELIEENIAATKDFYSQLVETGRELYSQLSEMSNNLSNETHFDVDFNIDKMGTTSTQELTQMYEEFYKYVDKKLSEELRKYGIKKKV